MYILSEYIVDQDGVRTARTGLKGDGSLQIHSLGDKALVVSDNPDMHPDDLEFTQANMTAIRERLKLPAIDERRTDADRLLRSVWDGVKPGRTEKPIILGGREIAVERQFA